MATSINLNNQAPWYLEPNDCIGDSLGYLNQNAAFTTTLATSASVNTLTTLINSVSALFALAPSVAKAWVNIDATKNAAGVTNSGTTNRYLRSNKNVSSVLRTGTGRYTLTFATPMTDANYSICITGNGPVNVQHCNPYIGTLTNTTCTFGFWDSADSTKADDPSIICIQVFGN